MQIFAPFVGTIMSWYKIRFWRFAYSWNRCGIITDNKGIWKHFIFGIYILVQRNCTEIKGGDLVKIGDDVHIVDYVESSTSLTIKDPAKNDISCGFTPQSGEDIVE